MKFDDLKIGDKIILNGGATGRILSIEKKIWVNIKGVLNCLTEEELERQGFDVREEQTK